MAEEVIHDIVSVEKLSQLNKQVKLVGLESANGSILAAGVVFDIRAENERFPYLRKFDYISVAPFGQPKLPEEPFTMNLQDYAKKTNSRIELFNRANEFFFELGFITNRNQQISDEVHDIIKNGTEAGRIPLFISGHGGEEEGFWKVGAGDGTDGMPINTLLGNIADILGTVNSSVPPDLKDRYSIVILNACNGDNIEIPQNIIEQLGTPLLYSKGIVVGFQNNSIPVIAHPA